MDIFLPAKSSTALPTLGSIRGQSCTKLVAPTMKLTGVFCSLGRIGTIGTIVIVLMTWLSPDLLAVWFVESTNGNDGNIKRYQLDWAPVRLKHSLHPKMQNE